MVKQIKAPKTSSKAREFFHRLVSKKTSAEECWKLIEGTEDKALLAEVLDRHLYERRKELLFDVANMHDGGFTRFSRRWCKRFRRSQAALPESDVLKLRDELRQIWRPEATIVEKQHILEGWQAVPHPIPAQPRTPFTYIGAQPLRIDIWKPVLHTGRIEPALHSIRAQLTQGVLEQRERLATCQNPDCPARYFLAKRSDQKYCGGECTAYAQRKYAREWWNREGKESRRRNVKRKPRVSRRRRK
jgi:hypothetical protein